MSDIREMIGLVICIGVVIGIIWLQVFLSKKQSKWLGLILPISCVLLSVIVVMGLFIFNMHTTSSSSNSSITYDTAGNIISRQQSVAHNNINIGSYGLGIVMTFLVSNIPTIILLCIYFGIRQQIKAEQSIEKMKIKDL